MSNQRTEILREYAEAVFARAREPVDPPGFSPDWADQPSRFTTHPGATTIDLCVPGPEALGPVSGRAGPGRRYSLHELSTMLYYSYAPLRRRIRVTWNHDATERTRFSPATWGRGTASGGGMYPVEVYWATGPSGPLLPGVYHYAAGHHRLERLRSGDPTARVRAATGEHPWAVATDQYLLLTVRFWKNAFKYASLSYHIVTQDLGALLGTFGLVAAAIDAPVRQLMWYDDRALDDLLGIETAAQSVFAVVPLPWSAPDGQPATGAARASLTGRRQRARWPAYERSARVRVHPSVELAHLSSLVDGQPRPTVRDTCPSTSDAGAVALPVPRRLDADLRDALLSRRSSFGGFAGDKPLSGVDLATILAFAAAPAGDEAGATCDVGMEGLTRLLVVANRVEGVPPGVYGYRPEANALVPDAAGARTPRSLQQSYSMANYNLDRVAAVVAIAGRLGTSLATLGNRGYRILNARAGAIAQAGYVAAAALGIGCGAVLGLDNLAMNDLLGLTGPDERSLLFLLLGPERAAQPDLDFRTV